LNIYALQNTAKEGATNNERMNNPHTPTPERSGSENNKNNRTFVRIEIK
tara:strand:- start:70 stop:216 length:147 start_codon:yes stop_codon:yes gene_type:complete